ncbi:hypothetical protein WA026_001424 [Henosepilachna vigintioctopunctata]|uniref:Small ribosomal subunit protein uS4 N-terminal domain-containing protein n=1 Tax=Henosepilachna vigintioctopunctata TaxID=420089 RepID=A0AAW1UTF1_9CUCU
MVICEGIVGKYGLRCKHEVWRVKSTLAKIRKAARELLTLEEKDSKRLFEGNALPHRWYLIGIHKGHFDLNIVFELISPSTKWCKREVWRVKHTLPKIRKAVRKLLTLEEKDSKRFFEDNALLRRLVRIGVLNEK